MFCALAAIVKVLLDASGVSVILLPAAIVNVSPTLPAFKLVAPTVTVPKALLLSIVAHSIVQLPAFLIYCPAVPWEPLIVCLEKSK